MKNIMFRKNINSITNLTYNIESSHIVVNSITNLTYNLESSHIVEPSRKIII